MKCGEFMPLIDNYLLDNYGLGGRSSIDFKSGVASSSASLRNFELVENGYNGYYSITIPIPPSIGFRPKTLIVRLTTDLAYSVEISLYSTRTRNQSPGETAVNWNTIVKLSGSSATQRTFKMYELTGGGVASDAAYISDYFVYLPVSLANTSYTWEAYSE